jgi:hypothetical protein
MSDLEGVWIVLFEYDDRAQFLQVFRNKNDAITYVTRDIMDRDEVKAGKWRYIGPTEEDGTITWSAQYNGKNGWEDRDGSFYIERRVPL